MSFDFILLHRAGKHNLAADFCSRHPVASLSSFNDPYSLVLQYLQGNLQHPSSSTLRLSTKFCLIDNQLYRKQSPFPKLVLFTSDQVQALLYQFHDLMSHPSSRVVQRWVLPRFWFPNLTRLILNYCKTCDICQKFQEKLPDYHFKGLSSISGLFHEFQMDFLGPLSETTKSLSLSLSIN
jgi:hypothetical protein